MSEQSLTCPQPSEYAAYYRDYVDRVGEGNILDLLSAQGKATEALLRSIDDERANATYAPGKWTIKEVVGHLVDVERVFAYRALCFARKEPAPQPGFDQDAYVKAADFNRRSLPDMTVEFANVRGASVALFRGFAEEAWLRRGVANGVEFSVRSIPYIVAGHELHHLSVLRERYL